MITSTNGNILSVWKARESMLMQLDSVLASRDIETRDQFNEIMKAAFGPCGLNVKKFSGDMRVSPSTAHRWISGVSAPHHKGMWDDAAAWLREEIKLECDNSRAVATSKRATAAMN